MTPDLVAFALFALIQNVLNSVFNLHSVVFTFLILKQKALQIHLGDDDKPETAQKNTDNPDGKN